ncbi:MAG: glycoside hydrolase family 97 catalytic domain-containing protein [Phycisphaerales bacterium]|nr:MAG: glycoside hydrolase family 97 catalytic domain-containing protein [Phycisphaerales bacterium]
MREKQGVSACVVGMVALLLSAGAGFCQSYALRSPDESVVLSVDVGEQMELRVRVDGERVVRVTDLAMRLSNGNVLGPNAKVVGVDGGEIVREVRPEIREKRAVISERFNELILTFASKFTLTLRAYDNGVAYRFAMSLPGDIVIQSENARFLFADGSSIICQKEKGFRSSYEQPYADQLVSALTSEDLCCLPALVTPPSGPKVLVTESDLRDYPGLWLRGTRQASLDAAFAGYPLEKSYEGRAYGHGRVTKHADYIAKTRGTRTFPWRILALARNDGDLITNQLVYLLAPPLALDDTSWIRPGVVTFDWWGRRNIYGVDFKAGINTATAKYFIDFAADFGFEYFLFDDGWCDGADLFKLTPDLDMEEVCVYAKQKGVGVMLWVIWATLDRQCEQALDQFAKWGIAGIKIDFMNRDDQEMVNFYHRIARQAARRHMVIDFHGAYKPCGLRRAYPNVLTREGLIEVEQNGWSDLANPEHHTLLPFIRMVAGPMDYIPGTMNNAQKHNFRPVGDRPMGLGTRAHDLALFVILESPMQMLPDAPSDYYRERECTEFIAQIPVQWDETRVLEARLGDYVVVARRWGETWFVGAITDWDRRQFDIKLDFLGDGSYGMEAIRDGLNADVRAIDYKKETQQVRRGQTVHIDLAPGGGWVARIERSDAPRESQQAKSITVSSDIAYKAEGTLTAYETERCKLDLYLPEGSKDFPTLLWFHGGGIQAGSKSDPMTVGIARWFAERGIAVALPNYRLSPKAQYPACLDDAAASVAWLFRNIEAYRGDPKKIYVSGHSAGGYLTAMIGLDVRYLQRYGLDTEIVAGLIPVSGQMITHSTVREERGIPRTRPIIDEAAPLYHVRSDAPRTLCICGGNDLPIRAEENRLFVAALKAAGHERVDYLEVPGRDHGTIVSQIPEPGDVVAQAVMAFIEAAAR